MGIRAIARITGVNKGTVGRTVREAGIACRWLHGVFVRDVVAPVIECDELWSFVGARDKRVESVIAGTKGARWTWLAFDPATRLALHWHIGQRDEASADHFFFGLSQRLAGRCDIRTDANRSYSAAVGGYSLFDHPAITSRAQTNGVERLNATIRQGLRRYARRSSGFSKTADAMQDSLSLFLFCYNFARAHGGIAGGVPARKAGLTTRAWSMAEVEEAITAVWAVRPSGAVWDRIVARMDQPKIPRVAYTRWPSLITPPRLVASASFGEMPCEPHHKPDGKRRRAA